MASSLGSNGEGNRKPGARSVISPEDSRQIEDWYLMGVAFREIGRRKGLTGEAVRLHFKTKIEPRWRAESRISFDQELSKIDHIERVAWEKFAESQGPERQKIVREVLDKEGVPTRLIQRATKWRTGEGHWLDLVKWAIELRAKLGGLLIQRSEMRVEVGIRVAGLKPEELTGEILGEILSRIEDRRAQRAALEGPEE